MKTHRLKTVHTYFERCWQQSKTFGGLEYQNFQQMRNLIRITKL